MHGIGMTSVKHLFKNINTVFIEQPFQTFINPQNSEINYDYLNQYKNQLIVINFSSEHWNGFDERVYKLLDNTDLNFLILTYDYTSHRRYPRMFYFPYWYYWSIENFENNSSVELIEKKYNLSCANFNHKFHRIYNYLILKNHTKFVDWLFTMNNHPLANPQRADDYPLDQDMIDEWGKFPHTDFVGGNYIADPIWLDSYLNLVTESTVLPKVFLTEKIWKPVACGQLFLVIGNPGTIRILEDLGVDTFSDIIDHKYYDNESDWKVRIHKVHHLIDDILKQDLLKINQQTYQRRKCNANSFLSGKFGEKYYQDLISCINTLN